MQWSLKFCFNIFSFLIDSKCKLQIRMQVNLQSRLLTTADMVRPAMTRWIKRIKNTTRLPIKVQVNNLKDQIKIPVTLNWRLQCIIRVMLHWTKLMWVFLFAGYLGSNNQYFHSHFCSHMTNNLSIQLRHRPSTWLALKRTLKHNRFNNISTCNPWLHTTTSTCISRSTKLKTIVWLVRDE